MSDDHSALRAQMRAQLTAKVMGIIGEQNERQAEWLAARVIGHLEKMLRPEDVVIQINPESTPEELLAQVHAITTQQMHSAVVALTDIALAATTLGVKAGQAR